MRHIFRIRRVGFYFHELLVGKAFAIDIFWLYLSNPWSDDQKLAPSVYNKVNINGNFCLKNFRFIHSSAGIVAYDCYKAPKIN
jgi:hypothetical protein